MIRFVTAIEIPRPREAVSEFVADPVRLPTWNSAVESVRAVGGNRYAMRRTLPSGPAENALEVAPAPPHALTLRTLSGPTPFAYRYSFEPSASGTRVVLHAEVELNGTGPLLGPLAAHAVKRGVDANLRTLRNILARSRRAS
jgi:hypothetical protein